MQPLSPEPETLKGFLVSTYGLHCSFFLGLPFRILNTKLVKPKKRNYNGDHR